MTHNPCVPACRNRSDGPRFIAEDAGDRTTVASRLVQVRALAPPGAAADGGSQQVHTRTPIPLPQRVLEKEAEAANWDVAALKAVPPGRQRRQMHDDITGALVHDE